MFRTIHGNLLPSCSDYEGAVRVWKNAHVHDRFVGWRGLANKRDTSKIVRMYPDGAVAFRYHATDVVIWRPNSLVVNCYDTPSTVVFASRFLPSGVHASTHRGEMWVSDESGIYQPHDKGLSFQYDGKWKVDTSTVACFERYVLDQKKAAAIRKIMKPFNEWRESMDRLLGRSRLYGTNLNCHTLFMEIHRGLTLGEIPEDMYKFISENMAVRYGDTFMHNCYVLGGAVTKEPVELGVLPPLKGKYQDLYAWNIV